MPIEWQAMKKLNPFAQLGRSLKDAAPRTGQAGTRVADLHSDAEEVEVACDSRTLPEPGFRTYKKASRWVATATGVDLRKDPQDGSLPFFSQPLPKPLPEVHARRAPHRLVALSTQELRRFAFLRWLGTAGSLMLGLGALGAGAMPTVGNPYHAFPGASTMGRMLQTSTTLCFVGIGMLVLAWVLMAPFAGIRLGEPGRNISAVSMSMMRRTFLAWTLPILLSAPMFTQDIYSYLANGAIVTQGLDPYSGGPIPLLGTDHVLARSVPHIWANSPSPYGPVALGTAAIIHLIAGDSIGWGVLLHRLISIGGLAVAGVALVHLARRCRVIPQSALWLGILNPLAILHLIGGIHNEAIQLGFALAGLAFGLRASDHIRNGLWKHATMNVVTSGFFISCAGMVKVTGFIGLGFVGASIAAALVVREWPKLRALIVAALLMAVLMVASIALVTAISGIGLGWVTGQGGAATIRSWMSFSTTVGVVASYFGQILQLGDHSEAMLVFTRGLGLAASGVFMIRMLWATFKGRINAVGALGVSTFILVIFFPVVQPWYALWAIIPLSAWANRAFFRVPVALYSVVISFVTIPRGLGMPPGDVLSIYIASVIGLIGICLLSYVVLRQRGVIGIH